MQRPVVLVTGTSSGIGRAATGSLRDAGCLVVATARRPADIENLEEEDQVETLALDVTDDASMQAAVEKVLARHGRIDALVNNAGYGVMLPLEELPMQALRQQFEVNLFGLHRLTQLVLPAMRQQEPLAGRWRGRIINVSSGAGYVSLPMMGAYSATKFAVRAMTLALHNEVRDHDVWASLVEPGRIQTRFGQRSAAERSSWSPGDERGPYSPLYERWDDVRFNSRGKDPRIIARRITHAVTARRPRLHYRAPIDARGANWGARLLPDAWLYAGVRTWFRR